MRLRPDGASGLLVSSFAAFCRYQREKAWTWEHQALTRARFVAGDAAIGAAFEAEREAILRLPRDPGDARRGRRSRCAGRCSHGHPNPTPEFDLKHDPGGMVDVEFAVQYLVLAHAPRSRELTRNAGNIALLGICRRARPGPRATGGAPRPTRIANTAACSTRSGCTGAPHARVDPARRRDRRDAVAALWSAVFGAPWALASPRGARRPHRVKCLLPQGENAPCRWPTAMA